MIHELKCEWDDFLSLVVEKRKWLKVSKNGKEYRSGDLVALNEREDNGDEGSNSYTGRSLLLEIIRVINDGNPTQPDGFIMLKVEEPRFIDGLQSGEGRWDTTWDKSGLVPQAQVVGVRRIQNSVNGDNKHD